MSIETIRDDLDFLDGWEDRLGYVMDLGRALPKLEMAEKNDLTRVRGCASQVWLVPETEGEILRFRGESDALIVSGLIAVVLALVNGKSADEILAIDVRAEFDKLGLAQHISGQRSNGLAAMATRIREIAGQAKQG